VCNWALSTAVDTKIMILANTQTQLVTRTSVEVRKWTRLSLAGHLFKTNTMSIQSADPKHEKTWRADFITWSENNTEAVA
ncbi:hypothetical protein, partial [Staphylococcus aureus]